MKFAIGVDVGASKIAIARISSEGIIADRKEVPTPRNKGVGVVVKTITDLIKQYNLDEIKGIGVGFPGVVSNGVVEFSTNISGFENVPLESMLKQSFDKKIVVLNDADATLEAESWIGSASGKKKVLVLTFGSGVGGAITGQPNAELGHTVIDPGSVLTCNRGHKGDIESLLGGLATEKRLGRSSRGILQDPGYQPFFITWLTQAIEILINLYQPEIVVLGGGVVESAQYFYPKLPKFNAPVVLAKLGVNAGVIGAGRSVMKGGLGDWMA